MKPNQAPAADYSRNALICAAAFGVVLAAGACRATGSEASAAPANPDETIAQVAKTMDDPRLAKHPVQQKLNLSIGNGEQADIYNLTKSPLNEAEFKNLLGYFATIADTDDVRSMVTYLPGGSAPQTTETQTALQPEKKHIFVLVSAGQTLPPMLTEGYPDPKKLTASTKFLPDLSETISVVQQPTDEHGKLTGFMKDGALPTEACQAVVEATNKPNEGDDPNEMADLLAKESLCNGFGDAAAAIGQKLSYKAYSKWEDKHGLNTQIFTSYGPYRIDRYKLTPKEYSKFASAYKQTA